MLCVEVCEAQRSDLVVFFLQIGEKVQCIVICWIRIVPPGTMSKYSLHTHILSDQQVPMKL
jgi:hypothetical protein